MFETRLKWFAGLVAAFAAVIILRLVDIQIVHAEDYAALADRILTRPVRYLPAPRGNILDRNGRVLVRDEPAFSVNVHYPVLSGNSEAYLSAFARELRRSGREPADAPLEPIVAELRHRITETWPRLAAITGRPAVELLNLAEQVVSRVQRVRAVVNAASGLDRPVREEFAFHPLIDGLDRDTAVALQLEFEGFPWVDVAPGSRRVAPGARSLVHVLGRLGTVSPKRIARDPLGDNELRSLRPGELCGISGVERLADVELRGSRGRLVMDFDGTVIERLEPVPGRDIFLSIDADLQDRVLEVLAEAVDNSENPAGGSAVVIDVHSRDVVALVSYPVYDYDDYSRDYARLRADARWLPLRFRAVADEYPPGSTCKAITLAGALVDGKVTPEQRIHCRGMMMPSRPNQFRCWIYNQYQITHDHSENPAGQDASDAIRNSCNIYFFTLGERLEADRLCYWFGQFGLGRLQGTGLIEETPAINPTADWLRRARGREPQVADAWNFSIGQGEVTVTPLQAANVAATIASGVWAPVRLAYDDQRRPLVVRSAPQQPVDPAALRIVRSGMWRVVNERGATGFHARLDLPGYELCGKTGTAQAVPRPMTRRWVLEWPDGRRESVMGGLYEDEILARYDEPKPRVAGYETVGRFPPAGPEDRLPSHAWFVGYTQPTGTPRGAVPAARCYAIAVIIEYGGGGGRVAGPVARKIAELVLQGGDAREVGLGPVRPPEAGL